MSDGCKLALNTNMIFISYDTRSESYSKSRRGIALRGPRHMIISENEPVVLHSNAHNTMQMPFTLPLELHLDYSTVPVSNTPIIMR